MLNTCTLPSQRCTRACGIKRLEIIAGYKPPCETTPKVALNPNRSDLQTETLYNTTKASKPRNEAITKPFIFLLLTAVCQARALTYSSKHL